LFRCRTCRIAGMGGAGIRTLAGTTLATGTAAVLVVAEHRGHDVGIR
jgi:hypothetical protein